MANCKKNMKPMKMDKDTDKKMDKMHGVKEGSKADKKKDKSAGIKEY